MVEGVLQSEREIAVSLFFPFPLLPFIIIDNFDSIIIADDDNMYRVGLLSC